MAVDPAANPVPPDESRANKCLSKAKPICTAFVSNKTICAMTIEIGQKIKEVFDQRKMKLTDFADQLGTVRQNVYRIFKKRHLDTGLLLKISQVLDYNFFQFYIPTTESATPQQTEEMKRMADQASEFNRQLELARKEIDYLRKIIHLMEEKAELVQQVGRDSMVTP